MPHSKPKHSTEYFWLISLFLLVVLLIAADAYAGSFVGYGNSILISSSPPNQSGQFQRTD